MSLATIFYKRLAAWQHGPLNGRNSRTDERAPPSPRPPPEWTHGRHEGLARRGECGGGDAPRRVWCRAPWRMTGCADVITILMTITIVNVIRTCNARDAAGAHEGGRKASVRARMRGRTHAAGGRGQAWPNARAYIHVQLPEQRCSLPFVVGSFVGWRRVPMFEGIWRRWLPCASFHTGSPSTRHAGKPRTSRKQTKAVFVARRASRLPAAAPAGSPEGGWGACGASIRGPQRRAAPPVWRCPVDGSLIGRVTVG